MAATETRLLVLGAVSLFGPANGYQIRRELVSWEIEDWANVNPGSIYSSLTTLTAQGHLERHDLADQERAVAVYTITASGRDELRRLYRVALESVEPLHPVAFHTALALLPLMPREVVVEHLRARLATLERAADEPAQRMDDMAAEGSAPPHLGLVADLWDRMREVERAWIQDTLARVEAGDLVFAGEDPTWTPPADDPGWQMARDRRRYLSLLAQRD